MRARTSATVNWPNTGAAAAARARFRERGDGRFTPTPAASPAPGVVAPARGGARAPLTADRGPPTPAAARGPLAARRLGPTPEAACRTRASITGRQRRAAATAQQCIDRRPIIAAAVRSRVSSCVFQNLVCFKILIDEAAEMSRCALFAVTAMFVAGLRLYMLGFFLTRFELRDVSECAESPLSGGGGGGGGDGGGGEGRGGCWMPRRFDRAVVIVIDALRYDFVAHVDDAAASDDGGATGLGGGGHFFLNRLSAITGALGGGAGRGGAAAGHASGVLLRFVADPPTVTMQRLKGLTAGSLPTFVDVRDNFGSDAIEEDNIVHGLTCVAFSHAYLCSFCAQPHVRAYVRGCGCGGREWRDGTDASIAPHPAPVCAHAHTARDTSYVACPAHSQGRWARRRVHG